MTATATKKKSKIKPLGNKIVVEKVQAIDKTQGGIYLPSGSQEKPLEGIVIAVGPGALNEKNERQAMQVKEGDKVLYSKYAGTEIKSGDKELLIVAESDVLAIIED